MDSKKILKVIGINLIVLLIYVALIAFWAHLEHQESMGYAFMLMFALGIHALVAISMSIVMFVQKKTDLGLGYIIAFLAVAIIGPSACFGGAQILF